MQRLERVFRIDIEHCCVCGGTLRVIACIEIPELIDSCSPIPGREHESARFSRWGGSNDPLPPGMS